MENLAYLQLAKAYQALTNSEPIVAAGVRRFFQALNAQKLSTPAWIGFFSVAIAVALLDVNHATLAALRLGDKGAKVAEVQNKLTDGGYYNGPITGYFDEWTDTAVKQFQRDQRIAVDGIVGPITTKRLHVTHIGFFEFGRGYSGRRVTVLQHDLNRLGYYDGNMTGYFGKVTQNSVRKFQEDYGLKVSGKADITTQIALEEAIVMTPTYSPEEMTIAEGAIADETAISEEEADLDAIAPQEKEPVADEASSSKTRILSRGASGQDVLNLQYKLKTAGYFAGPFTGYFGELTENAVKRLQRDRSLTVDGVVGPVTQDVLNEVTAAQSSPNSHNLARGASGTAVSEIQRELMSEGYLKGPITGYFGQLTEDAVKRFQGNRGLRIDGIVGTSTHHILLTSHG